jgi:endogenous inhibitor of DNA gyrase (YacG/DUF329 family)
MMKFEEEFPNCPIGGEPFQSMVRLLVDKAPCWHCGDLTEWVDIDFEVPICSRECLTAKVKEWGAALAGEGSPHKMGGGNA